MISGFFFDARYIRWDHHDGISRFSAGLFAALHARVPVTAIIYDLRQLEKLPSGTKYILANDPTKLSEVFIALKLNRAGAKVVFSPMQTMGSWFREYRLILTLHDLIYYRHPTPPPSFNLAIRLAWRIFHMSYWPQRWFLNRADAVVTVSKTSKRLIEKHRLTRRPVSVIYNAAGALEREYEHPAPKHRPRSQQKLVYMGSFMPYKNVELLVSAMNHLPNHELHLLSKISDFDRDRLTEIFKDGGGSVVFHNGVSEAEYHRQLDGAVALVTASRDEGFGIPLVEAMVRGLPIIVSDIEIFREIGGDAALYFDCDSPEEFTQQVKLLDDAASWRKHSELGLQQAKTFNWDKSAAALVQLVDQINS